MLFEVAPLKSIRAKVVSREGDHEPGRRDMRHRLYLAQAFQPPHFG